MTFYLWLGIAAAAGAFSRYWLSAWVAQRFPLPLPLGTFVVNVCGSFLLGVLATWAHDRDWLGPTARLAIGVGFLGSFATFSTFSVETVTLMETGSLLVGTLNAVGNLVAALAAAWLGMLAGRLF